MGLSRKVAALAMAAVAAPGRGLQLDRVGAAHRSPSLTPVKFQLQWVAQSQFAGYYAALDQNYYRDAGLDV